MPLKSKISSASIPVRSEMSYLKRTSTTGQGDFVINRKGMDSTSGILRILLQVSDRARFFNLKGQSRASGGLIEDLHIY